MPFFVVKYVLLLLKRERTCDMVVCLKREIDSNAEAVRDVIWVGCKVVPSGD